MSGMSESVMSGSATHRSGGLRDLGLLVGRIVMVSLFLPAGIGKITGWPGIVHYLAYLHAPVPFLAGIVAIVCEVGVSTLIVLGIGVRLSALVMAAFTLGTMFIAHRFWDLHGAAMMAAKTNFFKNLSIVGGFLVMASAGSGRYALRPDG